VFKLLPGYTLTLSRAFAVPAPRQYWDISLRPGTTKPADVEQELIARLKDASAATDGGSAAGAFLSGGVDSSAVVAMMAQLQDTPVNTCAIGFSEKSFNETEFAQQVADRYHTNHFMKVVARTTSTWSTSWHCSTTSLSPTARESRPTASASWRANGHRGACRAMEVTSSSRDTAATAGT